MTRREFAKSAVALTAGIGAAPAFAAQAATSAPASRPTGTRPVAISSANGLRTVDRAIAGITAGDDPLDSIVAGINIVEDDPNDHSVGYGGLPNEDGVVELDACVMDGPRHKAGGVASLRNIRNPSKVATLVMRRTDHVLIVGEGALRFARAHGFREENLLTDEAREQWLRWKENLSHTDDWLPPESERQWGRVGTQAEIQHTTGTITCMAATAGGDLFGCTSTSGLSYKIPGRVGDSPIIGAGLYVDNAAGACGSTGRGEANLQNCSSFLVVELMRSGRSPEEACIEVLRRVLEHAEPRLRTSDGTPRFGLTLYALRKDGEFGGASLGAGVKMAVHDGSGSRLVALPGLYEKLASEHP